MKQIGIFCLMMISFQLMVAQKAFEGTLTFSARYDGDKALVAKMANQMPDTMRLAFSEGKSFFEMSGGMSSALMNRMYADPRDGNIFLVSPSQRIKYQFTDASRKLAWANPKDAKAVVVRGEADQKMMGYNCEHYLIIQDTRRGRDTMEVWVAPKIKADLPNTRDLTGSGLFSLAQYGIEGFPMKIVHVMPVPGRTFYIILEIASVEPDMFDADELKEPDGFQVKAYNMVPPKR